MSDRFTCRTCGGQYADTQADGSTYMHTCSPVTPDAGVTWQPRPNGRDETVITDRKGLEMGLTAEGTGVVPIGPTARLEPQWISQMKARIAKRGA